MGGPRSVSSDHWRRLKVTLAPNSLVSSSAEVDTRQPSFYPEIRVGFPSSKDMLFFTTLVSLSSQIFPTPDSYLSSPIYFPSLVELSWWGDLLMLVGPFVSYYWPKGTYLLLLTWLPSNLCLMSVIAQQVDSPQDIISCSWHILGYLVQMFGQAHLSLAKWAETIQRVSLQFGVGLLFLVGTMFI